MTSQIKTFITPEEYLAIERKAETRSEYFAGEMFAMVDASRRHNRIVTNLIAGLDNQLRDRPCNVYANDLRVNVSETGFYAYPDVVVTCGDEQFADSQNDVLLNPVVIIEVLSDSTEAYDRGKKFEHYQQIESLREYLLVTQNPYRVEQFVRQSAAQWLYSEARRPEDVIKLDSIECELTLIDIYVKAGQ